MNKGQNLNVVVKVLMFEVFGLQEIKKSSFDKFFVQVNESYKMVDVVVLFVFEMLDFMLEIF